MNNRNKIYRLALAAILCAQAIALSFIESLIPPLPFLPPGAKPGLSNIVTMFAADCVGAAQAYTITVIKSLFVFITRGFTAAAMSLAGGLLSCTAMILLIKFSKERLGIIGISVISALCHNAGQLIMSVFITGSDKTFYYAPFLAVFGVITGILTGIIFKAVLPALNAEKKHFVK
ncbi:MAG: Gx transporter family protein [Clostridia bacterium]|nr:Gx transporter family protein [Clostridia bacterium]